MNHLYQEVSKKGMDFLNSIFEQEVTISEKIDGTALVCKKINDEIVFFGREGAKKIDKITRMFSNMYDDGIEHLKKQDLSFMRNNDELVFEYFSPKVTHIVNYARIPENGLVLLKSTVSRNLDILAHDIGVLPPPIIFKGKLNNNQKEELTKFLIMSPELRQVKFKTNSFTNFIINVLNDKYKTVLGNDDLEGVVILTNDGTFISKIVDPMFTDTIMSKKVNDDVKAKYFSTVSKLVTYLDLRSVENYHSDETDPEERYIDFLMNVIENNIGKIMGHKSDFAEFNYGVPYIATYTDFNYNMFSSVLANLMKENPWFRDFMRLAFSNYTKTKGRATKNFSKEDIAVINKKIEQIKKYVLLDQKLDVNESSNEILEAIENYGVMFGRFQPLTKGHLKGIDMMANECEEGCVYIVKGAKSSKDKDKNPFDEKIQIKMLKAVLPSNIEVKIAPSAFYPDIINELEFTSFKLYAGTDRVQAYKKMLSYVNDDKEVTVEEIKRSDEDISATKVRTALNNDDKDEFMKLTPNEIHKFYDELKDIIRGE